MPQPHSSPRIMYITILVAVLLIVLVAPLTIKGDKSAAMSSDADGAEVRVQPVAKFELAKAPSAAAGKPKDGATIYASICSACHGSGAAGSPKAGDKAAWAPRIAQGKEALYKSALNGKNAMPPKGGAGDLSDAEIKSAVDHLVGLAK